MSVLTQERLLAEVDRDVAPSKTVVVVEDDLMMREVVKKICLGLPNLSIGADASTGRDGIARILEVRPDIVVLDIGLADLTGFELIEKVRSYGFYPRFIILSNYDTPYAIYLAERARVNGFVDKHTNTLEDIRKAILSVSNGAYHFSESFHRSRRQRIQDPFAFDKILTEKQMEIMGLLARLLSDPEIAVSEGISERTVEAHRTIMMRKFEVHSRLELIAIASNLGFGISPKH